jgi:hypothetical protein
MGIFGLACKLSLPQRAVVLPWLSLFFMRTLRLRNSRGTFRANWLPKPDDASPPI